MRAAQTPGRWLLWTTTLAPALAIGVLVARHALDMPYMDDWSLSSDLLVRYNPSDARMSKIAMT